MYPRVVHSEDDADVYTTASGSVIFSGHSSTLGGRYRCVHLVGTLECGPIKSGQGNR